MAVVNGAATCRTSTTSSPAPIRTGVRLPATRTRRARATRAMPTAPEQRDARPSRSRLAAATRRGIPRTDRAAAASPIWWRPAARVCSTVSRRISRSDRSCVRVVRIVRGANESNTRTIRTTRTIYSSICQSARGCGPGLMWAISGSPSASDVGRLLVDLRVLTARRLLLATFDQRLLALALRGGWSCVSGHAEALSIHQRQLANRGLTPWLSIAPATG